MVVIDAVVRHIPGVLGAEGAQHRDSHADGLLEGPHYTRPPEFRGLVHSRCTDQWASRKGGRMAQTTSHQTHMGKPPRFIADSRPQRG